MVPGDALETQKQHDLMAMHLVKCAFIAIPLYTVACIRWNEMSVLQERYIMQRNSMRGYIKCKYTTV